MTDEDAPAEAGTSEEQHETDGSGIPVQAVAEGEAEQEQDEMNMAEQMAELQEILGRVDPENVAVAGATLVTKETYENADGEDTTGFQWRVVNPDLDGYEDVNDVVRTLAEFNDSLDTIEVAMEKPKGPAGLAGMLGLE